MSKRYLGLSAAALLAIGLGWGPPAASAAPVAGAIAINNAAAPAVEQVAWGRGWGGGGWGGRGWGGGWGWGLGAGLLGGAIIGSALAAPYYYGTPYGYGYAAPGYYGAPGYGPPGVAPGYGPGPDAVAFCSRRYRSYDPSTGTFLGNDGVRHPCP
jgi:hypothetical protein